MSDVNATSPSELTLLFQSWKTGDPNVLNQVIPMVYDDLRSMARRFFAGQAPQTLQPTDLVHGVYERLMGSATPVFENRMHFFNTARVIMRQLLVEHARIRGAAKRAGGPKTNLDEYETMISQMRVDPDTMLALSRALDTMRTMDPRMCRILELRFFIGLQIEEIAELLDVTPRTIRREWQTARGWLARQLKHDPQARQVFKRGAGGS